MFKFIARWFRNRQCQIDIDILWPSIKQTAPNISRAREAFYLHCINDEAWRDLTNTEITYTVEKLK